MQETWVLSPGWEDPLEQEMETPSSILAWQIQGVEEPRGLQSIGSRVGHHGACTHLAPKDHSLRSSLAAALRSWSRELGAGDQYSRDVVKGSPQPSSCLGRVLLKVTRNRYLS